MKALEVLKKKVKEPVCLPHASKEVIKALQFALKELGLYNKEVDGIVGEGTIKAFHLFKDKSKLSHRDLLGATTVKALVEALEDREAPKDVPASRLSPTPYMTLPGGLKVSTATLIVPGGHFTWGEATKGLTRKPENEKVVHNIIRAARAMEEIRRKFGDRPVTVNSWYRPPSVNRAVGGASSSRHLTGEAVDFTVQGISPSDVQRLMEQWWGAKGGLASARNFTHMDVRGYKARWRYN